MADLSVVLSLPTNTPFILSTEASPRLDVIMNATFFCNDSGMKETLYKRLAPPLGIFKIYTLYEPLLQDDEDSQYVSSSALSMTSTNIPSSLVGLVVRKEWGLAYVQCRVTGRFPHYELDLSHDRKEFSKESSLRACVSKSSPSSNKILYTVVLERKPARRVLFRRRVGGQGHS